MNIPSVALPSALLLTLAPILASQEIGPEIAPVDVHPSMTVEDDGSPSIFGEPLIVNGRRIPDMEIMRYLCYGRARGGLESRKMEVLLTQEVELRAFMREQEILDEVTACRNEWPGSEDCNNMSPFEMYFGRRHASSISGTPDTFDLAKLTAMSNRMSDLLTVQTVIHYACYR